MTQAYLCMNEMAKSPADTAMEESELSKPSKNNLKAARKSRLC